MKIAIIGAGAMGSLYGGYLNKSGNEVYLIDVWKEHVDAINTNGLQIEEPSGAIYTYPKAVTQASLAGIVELAVVFVKSIMTYKALEANKAVIGPDTMVLSLQNGYGNIEEIEKFVGKDHIIAGTTAHGATMLGPGKIKHAGVGDTHIGSVLKGKEDRIMQIVEVFKEAGFAIDVSDNVMKLIWEKLIINVGINALTAAVGMKNGELLDFDETKEIMELLVYEAVNTANANGMDFNRKESFEKVKMVAERTAQNKSSMLQDIANKRKTEIEMINGAIVREGQKNKISTPVNKVLLNMIRIMEKKY